VAKGAITSNPWLYKLPYDTAKLTPVALLSAAPQLLAAHPSAPFRNFREMIAYGKANPGKLTYGHGSAGSLVSGALLVQMAGLDAQPVAYKGIPPALTDLVGGSLQFAFADVGNAVAQMGGGKLRGLAVTTSRRAGRAPNVPTIAEAGVPGYEVEAWFGLMAPAGLPAGVQPRLSQALLAALAKPDVRERLTGAGVDVDPQDAPALAKTIDAEIRRWAKWVKDAGIQPE